MFDFIKNIGKKLFSKKEEAPQKIKEHIEEDNPGMEQLEVAYKEDGNVSISGVAKDEEALQKAALMAGNVEGVSNVDVSGVEVVEKKEVRVEIYEIQKGDSLWKIAQKFYGDGNKWKKIYEDNKEVIKDPDLIYPGQKIRIVLED